MRKKLKTESLPQKFVNIPNRIQLFWQKMVNYWPQVQDKPQE